MMDEARHVVVTGEVQGVGFRAWARDTAQELGLTGWVRNRPDGTVEAHLEGSGTKIAEMIDRLQQGPSAGRVDDVAAEAAEPDGSVDFGIRG